MFSAALTVSQAKDRRMALQERALGPVAHTLIEDQSPLRWSIRLLDASCLSLMHRLAEGGESER